MKMLFTVALLILASSLISDAVIVQEGGFSFSLESVKKLWAIMADDVPANRNSRLSRVSAVTVCKNTNLPPEFQPLCQSRNAPASFSRLALLSRRPGVCEVCAYAACSGCRYR